jgi:hypothetical protein
MVTIVVNNFNYRHFVGDAIESAIGQAGDVEVIVVDDGSTDDSRSVIDRYAPRIRRVYKENGGQASAYNAGFGVSSGEFVIFLDADDVLLPDTALRVERRFRAQPALAKVHYRLRVVDAVGRATGRLTPPAGVPLSEGDLACRLRRTPDDIVHPPASGNAFAAWALDRVLPLPEDRPTLADVLLLNLVPLLGPVGALEGVGGCYRTHGGNRYHSDAIDIDRIRGMIETSAAAHGAMAVFAVRLRLASAPSEIRPVSVTDLAQRLISLRLEPELHPIAGDKKLGVAARGIAAVARRRDMPARHRVLYAAWFGAMPVAPRKAARWLSERLFAAWQDGVIRRPRGGHS